jgi:ABC-type multidrug transport system ATPase subunit
VIDELKERSNLAIVVVEHHTEELALFADRIWVMNEGEILLDDQARRVFHQTELLRSIGVCPPDAVELLSELRRCGLVAPAEELMQEEEIVRFLSEHLNGRS